MEIVYEICTIKKMWWWWWNGGEYYNCMRFLILIFLIVRSDHTQSPSHTFFINIRSFSSKTEINKKKTYYLHFFFNIFRTQVQFSQCLLQLIQYEECTFFLLLLLFLLLSSINSFLRFYFLIYKHLYNYHSSNKKYFTIAYIVLVLLYNEQYIAVSKLLN